MQVVDEDTIELPPQGNSDADGVDVSSWDL